MVQDDCGGVAVAGVRRRGPGVMDGLARQRQRRHDLGAGPGRRGLLGGHLSPVAQTDLGLCLRPRVDARLMDLAPRGAGQKIQSFGQGRARRSDAKQFFDFTGALFLPAVRGAGGGGVRCRTLALELAKLSALVSSVFRRGLRFSRDAHLAHPETHPNGYH